MSLSIRSPGGYGPNSAVLRSQVLTQFPTNYAISFWLGGFVPTTRLLQTDISKQLGSAVIFNLWNMAPFLWLGDPTPNVTDSLILDPTSRTRFAPNFSWAFVLRYTGTTPTPALGVITPSTDDPKQALLYDTYPSDLYFQNSEQVSLRNPTGLYGWNTSRPNHIYFSVTRVPLWYDWAAQYTLAINGVIQVLQVARRIPLSKGPLQVCIGSPAIPLNDGEEIVLEDFRIYEVPLDVPPNDGTPGGNWDFRNSTVDWSLPQELAYQRGRDRVALPLFAQVPFMTLTPGTAYPNASTFQDVTGRLTFTVDQAAAYLSQAPVTALSSRPILGRGRNLADHNNQIIDAVFSGRTDSLNGEYNYEGAFVDSDEPRTWQSDNHFTLPAATTGALGDTPTERADSLSQLPGGKLENGA